MNHPTFLPHPFVRYALVLLFLAGLFVVCSHAKDPSEREPSKKEMRKAKRAARAGLPMLPASAERVDLPPPAPIGNAPQPAVNTTLRLDPATLAKVASVVDRRVREGLSAAGLSPNPPASDSVFVRRIYLDVVGRIPSEEEAAAFHARVEPDKRRRLIDELLVSEGHRSHMFNWLADMLRATSYRKRADFNHYHRWLKDGLRTNRGWDEMVRDMLTAEGSLASEGAAGYLMRDFGMPLDGLSNTLTLFLGANVSCAQCHDHPLADWTQREFYEMAAFFGATDVSARDPRKVGNRLKNNEISKQDVILHVAPNLYRIKTLPGNELTFPEDYAYDDVKPGDPVQPLALLWADGDGENPAYDGVGTAAEPALATTTDPAELRQRFAIWLTHPENPRFALAIANRAWERAFGLAVLQPIDDLDDLEKSANPALMRLLGELMVKSEFDLREFQRVVYNTRAYQAESSPLPAMGEIEEYLFPGPVLRRMTAEQAWDSVLLLAEGAAIDETRVDRSHRVTRFAFPVDDAPSEQLAERTAELKKAGYLSKSTMGHGSKYDWVDPRRTAEKFDRSQLLRASELEQPTRDAHFLRMFGQSSRDLADDGSREGSIPQILMLMNGKFQALLTAKDGRLMQTLKRNARRHDPVETLYQTFYSRSPTAAERATVKAALDKGTSLETLVWVLFNTPEFLFVQ